MAFRTLLPVLLFPFSTALLPAQSGDDVYFIRNVRLFDGESVVERQTVVISDGRIAAVGSKVAVPAGAQEISGEGRSLLPGLMDAHVHLPLFGTAAALQQNLAFGVTTVVVMWAPPPLVAQVKEFEAANRPDMAAVFTAGTGATAPGGHPTQMDPQAAKLTPTLTSPREADAFVAARLAEGSDGGASLHRELEHLVNAGVTPTAALTAATSAIARAFRMSDRGRIRTGMRADLLLVDGDPSKQIRDTRNIVAIWKRGVKLVGG